MQLSYTLMCKHQHRMWNLKKCAIAGIRIASEIGKMILSHHNIILIYGIILHDIDLAILKARIRIIVTCLYIRNDTLDISF